MSKAVTYEGVTFVVSECLAMGKDKFMSAHIGAFWLDREESVRMKLLAGAWSKISQQEKKQKN